MPQDPKFIAFTVGCRLRKTKLSRVRIHRDRHLFIAVLAFRPFKKTTSFLRIQLFTFFENEVAALLFWMLSVAEYFLFV
jgi:hypothetical protein